MSWVLVVALGIVLGVTLLVTRRSVHGTGWLLLRSVFPAWRFFEDVESTTDLYYRSAEGLSDPYGPWRHARSSPCLGAASVFFNPEGNLALAEQSLVEQLLADLDGCAVERATSLVPYRLVQELVKRRLREDGLSSPARYQFRLDADGEEAFVSDGHSL